jgi:hypothetical protein
MDRLRDEGRDRSITDGPYGVAGSGRVTTLTVKGLEGNHGDPATGGSEGTVAEDRGATLVVFFHHQTPPSDLDEQDLRRLDS